ncbi:alpha/beta fold hydrolase [Paractinoplanes brasiliensis]|uniref:alpha/beta fold hydrolase n=1 Tax=Paractinoplanes brasiliensis TaxID=52695 RepID=UPI001EF29F30|nr:alpha/beta hydrolase [Actinoplanes brasiliensis]
MTTCLLLHGGAGPAPMRPLAELLPSPVLVPTHPGFDGTDRPAELASIRDLAAHYAGRIDDDVTVVGNSIGGWVAAELALLGVPGLRGVVLVNAVGLDVPGHPVTDVRGLTPEELAKLSFHDPARVPADPSRQGPDVAALAAYTGMRMTDPTLRSRLSGAKVPAHVIWGESDGIVTADYGRAYAEAIPGATFTLLPEAGHLPQLEAPDRLAALIRVVVAGIGVSTPVRRGPLVVQPLGCGNAGGVTRLGSEAGGGC